MNSGKEGRVCCIIGGTSGIGREVALGFAAVGDTVVISGRDPGKLKKACEDLKKAGHASSVMQTCDVTRKSSLEKLLKKILSHHKKVDVLVVAAGTHLKKQALRMINFFWFHDKIRKVLQG